MKEFFICDCSQHENKVITSTFVVVSKQVKSKRPGALPGAHFGDRTGQIEAKMDNVEDFISVFEQDDFLKIKGLINKYKNRFQLTIHKLRRMQDAEIDFSDYLPKTSKDIGELWRTLTDFIATFENPHLKALVELFLADPDIRAARARWPPSRSIMLTSEACSIM
jgi:3'-5' exoribonuclease